MVFLLSIKINTKEKKLFPKYMVVKNGIIKQIKKELNSQSLGSFNIFINNQQFVVWFDKKYKKAHEDELVPTLVVHRNDKNIILFGDVLFAKADKKGFSVGLSEEEVEMVRNFIVKNHREDLPDCLNKILT